MGIRNHELEEQRRLREKTLDTQFLTLIQDGLNCSPFEATAVLDAVKEVYFPVMDDLDAWAKPGILGLVAIAADEPGGKPLRLCRKLTIRVTLHRGEVDDQLLQSQGPAAFRRTRIPALLQEAVDQGALLTREDLAYRIFGVTPRTISADLAALRQQTVPPDLPLRGTVHDIGPVLSHRVEIVRRALAGHATLDICRQTTHSPEAVANYLSVFTRTAHLRASGFTVAQIAFLLHRGEGLIHRYVALLEELEAIPSERQRLTDWLTQGPGTGAGKGGALMSRAPDYVAKKFTPQLRRTVEVALADAIREDFPRLGGPRLVEVMVKRLLEVVDAHHYRQETLHHGQILWAAIAAENPPAHRERTTGAHLRPIVLDLVTPDDIASILQRETPSERLTRQGVRLCHQAYQQGAVLSNCDLALLLHVSEGCMARLLSAYETRTQQTLPRRGTLHDVGTAITHKRIICLKRYRDGKESITIARETYHSLEAVDRYLQQYARVRRCRQHGFTPAETAVTLQCSQRLVEEYLAIDDEMRGVSPPREHPLLRPNRQDGTLRGPARRIGQRRGAT